MITQRFLTLASVVTFGLVSSQCALYQNWRGEGHSEPDAQFVNSIPSAAVDFTYEPPHYLPRMPDVGPVAGKLLSERTYEFGGRKYLEQRIMLSENPLETELRVTQIP